MTKEELMMLPVGSDVVVAPRRYVKVSETRVDVFVFENGDWVFDGVVFLDEYPII